MGLPPPFFIYQNMNYLESWHSEVEDMADLVLQTRGPQLPKSHDSRTRSLS